MKKGKPSVYPVRKGNFIILKKGPQFASKYRKIVYFLSLVLLILTIPSLYYFGFLSIIFFSMFLICLNYVIDVRGIEIDLSTKMLREYKSFFGHKRGKWLNLSIFEAIRIDRKILYEIVKVGNEFEEYHPALENYIFYNIKIIEARKKHFIKLASLKNRNIAIEIAQIVSQETGIRYIETIKDEAEILGNVPMHL